ncbi:MAG: hypothetical protein QF879_21365, partial [Candidatus Latescibacteria bacterium]|nr:hypothetical protein [Candidatus Latescibacterota bacterium]
MIVKKGTIRTFLCETTPFVFKGRLYRFEAIRAGFINDRVESPDKDYFQIVDQSTGEVSEPFARSYRFGSAFVDGDTVYVTGTNGNAGKQVWIFASKNLKDWQSWKSLDLPGFGMWNTSLCKADDHYAMMMEISKPANQAGVGFTARFAISHDLKNWELTGPECAHTKERYSADGSLRYMDGYYYYFYSEAYDRSGAAYAEQYNTGYRTDVVRSRDMIHWQGSEFNPVLISSPEDEGRIANSELTEEQRGWIAESAMADICNYDIDFC